MTEQQIIETLAYYAGMRNDVICGIGDDAAIVKPPDGYNIACAMDTVVQNVHFPENTAPQAISHRALAVNLSDLAAMGASPAWFTLSLAMPTNTTKQWITQFCQGIQPLVHAYRLQLIGGDVCRGPLSVTVQAHGFLPEEQALARSGARNGDMVYVSGELGWSRYGLSLIQNNQQVTTMAQQHALDQFYYPQPRCELGQTLLSVASAAIDISDGLSTDLWHLLQASHVGAKIQANQLPISSDMSQQLGQELALDYALHGGEDYELCFTVAPHHVDVINHLSKRFAISPIGEIISEEKLELAKSQNSILDIKPSGYHHFK